MAVQTLVGAITSTLDQALAADKDIIMLGEDIGLNGGVFRATDGLQAKHGKDRVVDTPLDESGKNRLLRAVYTKPYCLIP